MPLSEVEKLLYWIVHRPENVGELLFLCAEAAVKRVAEYRRSLDGRQMPEVATEDHVEAFEGSAFAVGLDVVFACKRDPLGPH